MNRRVLVILAIAVAALGIVASGAVFTVHQTEQALVLQFGEPKRVIREPGLKFKIPFIQEVKSFDKRILAFDAPAEEVIASDQKRLVVDAFLRFKIVDPLKFYQSVRDERIARSRLDSILDSSLRRVLGREDFSTVLSGERATLMNEIADAVNEETASFGINVIDVRIKRDDLPTANRDAIYRQMQAEREREAKEFRAQGAEIAQRVRAEADREKTVLLAEAQRESEILRGQGDGQVVRIFADAFGRDIDFFTFYRSMLAYREALGGDDTSMVLSPDSEFFRYFGDLTGGRESAE